MGIAAYNRGTACLSRQTDAEVDHERARMIDIIDRLNAYPKGSAVPFGPCVLESDRRRGWWVLNAGDDRHSRRGYWFKNQRSAMAAFSVAVTGIAQDRHGWYFTLEPLPRESTHVD